MENHSRVFLWVGEWYTNQWSTNRRSTNWQSTNQRSTNQWEWSKNQRRTNRSRYNKRPDKRVPRPNLRTPDRYKGTKIRHDNISTRREVVEFQWDTQNTQTLPYWEYWEYMGWKGTERQCANGPHTSVLMHINNLEIRSLFTKLSLGITLVVWIKESGSNLYQEETKSGKHLD